MLEIDAVTKRYGRAVVLDSVSAEVREGEVVALAGPNGAGKSTLIHMVTGLSLEPRGAASRWTACPCWRAGGSMWGSVRTISPCQSS